MTALLQRIGRLLRGGLGRLMGATPVSSDYEILTAEEAAAPGGGDGWHESTVAEWQDRAYRGLLAEMHAGRPRNDLQVAAEAVRLTGLADPTVLEVGCGSGYYSEVLSHLLGHPVRYTGLDYSPAMIGLARTRYPAPTFVVGDAAALPFADATFDVVINGAALMHMLRYREAIAESRRVSRGWCVLHTVPVLAHRPTTYLRKRAYGRPTVEVVFNEEELHGLFRANGLALRRTFDSVPYDLAPVLGEPTASRTYLCQVVPG